MKTALSMLIALALTGPLAGCGCGRDKDSAAPAERAVVSGSVPSPVAGDAGVWAPSNQPTAVLMVNAAPFAEIGTGGPVFVGCRISNPQPDAELPLASGKDIVPRLTGGPDGAVATWEFLAEDVTVLPPRTGVGLLWRLTAPLPPGDYRVDLDSTALIRTNLSIHMQPALLTVTTNDCDPRLAARGERRLLLLQGKTNEYLQAVQAARAASPDDRMLLKEEADALECVGRNEEALQKVFELGETMLGRVPTNAVVDPPDWLVFRLELLQKKIAREKAGRPPAPTPP